MTTCLCPKCLLDKPCDQFYKSTNKENGLTIYCKLCCNLLSKEGYEKNKTKRLKQIAEYRANHPVECREYNLRSKAKARKKKAATSLS